jgi:hypothetical protein
MSLFTNNVSGTFGNSSKCTHYVLDLPPSFADDWYRASTLGRHSILFANKSIHTVQPQVLLAWQHFVWNVRRHQNQLANQLAWEPPLAPGNRRKIEVGDRGLQSNPFLKFFFSFLLFLCSECDIENTLFSLSLSFPNPSFTGAPQTFSWFCGIWMPCPPHPLFVLPIRSL